MTSSLCAENVRLFPGKRYAARCVKIVQNRIVVGERNHMAGTKIVDLRPEWTGDVRDVYFRVLDDGGEQTGETAEKESKGNRRNGEKSAVEVVVGDETARIVFRCSDRKVGASES